MIMLFSRFLLVVLLLSVPMQDPLWFSAQSGQSLIPDPGGVNAGSFSVPVIICLVLIFFCLFFLLVSIILLIWSKDYYY